RLVRAEDGERFVHVLGALLDGRPPSTRPTPAVPVVPLEDLGPVPDVDAASLTDNLSGILTDVGAMAVVLIDRTGRILSEVGAVGYLDREQLTATLAPVFAHMVHIRTLIGGDRPQAMHFYDGDAFDIFALAVGLHHFICLIFEGSAGSRAFGAVTMFGRRAVQDMLQTIGDAAFELIPADDAASDQPEKSRRKSSRKRKTQEILAAETQASAEQDDASAHAATLDPLPDDADLEAMLAGIDSIDLSAVDDLFDPDKLAEIAADKEKQTAQRMSYDEAQKLGVIRKD
ncbi:MAG: hypothetical protein JXN59_19230, partial [Anaerolineae bacterium]|nr:hypothetical protein [Anaerolineae bacterium]